MSRRARYMLVGKKKWGCPQWTTPNFFLCLSFRMAYRRLRLRLQSMLAVARQQMEAYRA